MFSERGRGTVYHSLCGAGSLILGQKESLYTKGWGGERPAHGPYKTRQTVSCLRLSKGVSRETVLREYPLFGPAMTTAAEMEIQ